MPDDAPAAAIPLAHLIPLLVVVVAHRAHRAVGQSSGRLRDLLAVRTSLRSLTAGVALSTLVVLIVLHVAAVLLHWLLKRDNLVAPMFSGHKPGAETRSLRFASGWLALALLIMAIAAVFVLSRYGD